VNSAARKVISGDLSGRIAIRGTGDDFDRLGETLNLMLARIEALLESVRRVSDNVAHELRTPLARLLVNLEELEDETEDPARQKELRNEAIREAQRLHRIFDALLRIARIESGRHTIDKRPFDLSGLAEDAVDTYQPDAETKGILLQADISPDTTIVGDPDMIYQALSNLIENALKYSPAGSKILVRVVGDQNRTTLSVADNGPGVKLEDHPHLGERFYRSAATRHLRGEGLGLSLVTAIAVSHDGRLSFRDNDPGLIVELTFTH
jgi:signal transduction histidine kinase